MLRKQGFDAQAVATAKLNDSIPPLVRAWKVDLAREYTPRPDDTYILIDVSEPGYFEKFVDMDRVDEIIDHHPGFEDFWKQRIFASLLKILWTDRYMERRVCIMISHERTR